MRAARTLVLALAAAALLHQAAGRSLAGEGQGAPARAEAGAGKPLGYPSPWDKPYQNEKPLIGILAQARRAGGRR